MILPRLEFDVSRDAINQSIRETRTVTLYGRIDSIRWVALVAALSAECDGWLDADATLRDYWGSDANGDFWRIYLDGMRF